MLTSGNASQPNSIAIADFNNDDHMDIAVADSAAHSIDIFLGYGNISFASEEALSTGLDSSPYSIVVGDFNNDSRQDIVVANNVSNYIGLFLGYGNGSFANQTAYSTGLSQRSVAVADFNNDTILDILIASYDSNNIGVLCGHGDGTFADIFLIPMEYGSRPFSLVVADFNNDKKLDFVVANNGTDSLSIYLQAC